MRTQTRTKVDDTLSLWDYRRQVAALYEVARSAPGDPETRSRWASGRDRLFADHDQSPLPPSARPSFAGLDYFPHDPDLVFDLDVEEIPPAALQIPHSRDNATPAVRFGRVHFRLQEEACRLDLYWLDSYGGGVFVPFRDATSGIETYTGGRYLVDTAKGADLGHSGRTVHLDFNYAYHPSCVYDTRWSCPLAPPENHLRVPVRGGERLRTATGRDAA
jgi:uncharacterized protein